jgi:hypothetical protein
VPLLIPDREPPVVTRLFPEEITRQDVLLAVLALLATLVVATLFVFALGASG